MTPRTAIVTGASGRIGSALVARLVRERWRVVSAGRSDPDLARLDLAEASLVRHVSIDRISDVGSHVSACFHLAAGAGGSRFQQAHGARLLAENVALDATVAEQLGSLEGIRVIWVSSLKALDLRITDGALMSADGSVPNGYVVSKLVGETVARKLATDQNLEVSIVRPAAVIGPWLVNPERRTLLEDLVYAGVRNREAKIGLHPGDLYAWIHVEALVEAMVAMADAPLVESANLATDVRRMEEIVSMLHRLIGHNYVKLTASRPRFDEVKVEPIDRQWVAGTAWKGEHGLANVVEHVRSCLAVAARS